MKLGNIRLKPLERPTFITLVKFAPGKGPQDVTNFFDIEVEGTLKNRGYEAPATDKRGLRRHHGKLDVHELFSYVTWGEHDMVIVWDAKDMEAAHEFLDAWASSSSGFGTTSTLVAARGGDY
jgi:hypothetical protein